MQRLLFGRHNGKLRSLAAVADLITVEDRLVFARLRQAEAIVRPGDRAEVADHDQLAAAAIDAAEGDNAVVAVVGGAIVVPSGVVTFATFPLTPILSVRISVATGNVPALDCVENATICAGRIFLKNLIGLTFAKTLSNTALIKYESIMNAIKHTINNITSDQIIPDELIPFPTLVATKVKTAYGVSSITQSRILKMISLSASTKFLNGFTFSSLLCATNTYATATRIAVKIIGIVFSSAISDITFLGNKFMKISENDVTLLWNVVVSSPSIERYAFLPTPKTSPKPSANIMAKNVVVISHRSEERRVGKECRSRWSPYH